MTQAKDLSLFRGHEELLAAERIVRQCKRDLARMRNLARRLTDDYRRLYDTAEWRVPDSLPQLRRYVELCHARLQVKCHERDLNGARKVVHRLRRKAKEQQKSDG